MKLAPHNQRILFLSLEHWDDVWRRNQIVCAQLLDRHPNAEILWVGPPTDLWNIQGVRSVNAPLGQLFQPTKNITHLYALKPFKPLPNVIGKQLNQWLFTKSLAAAMKKLGWTNYVTWVNNQAYCRLLPSSPSLKLIYDITDDWTHATGLEHILAQTRADDEWMLAHADDVIVCSEELYRSKVQRCKNIKLIRNGVTIKPYLPESLAANTVPINGQYSTVAGYVGTLHEDRLDVKLIEQVANRLPHVHFVFVGPNLLSAASNSAMQALPNCHLLGARPYEQIPSYMAGFNICITPHVVTAFTESLDPIKMYEYMATGKPIVSTACAGFRELQELIFIANDSNQFADLIEQAVNEGNERASARVDWARKQTWDQRVDEIEKLLGWSSAHATV